MEWCKVAVFGVSLSFLESPDSLRPLSYREYLTGFHKRKVERKKAAIEEIKQRLKKEQKQLREEVQRGGQESLSPQGTRSLGWPEWGIFRDEGGVSWPGEQFV